MKTNNKQVIVFLIFIIYIISIFLIQNLLTLTVCFIINIILTFIWKIKILKVLYQIIRLLPFIIFTAILNGIFTNLESSILITIHLLLVCHITYLFSQKVSAYNIGLIIEKLLSPLKLLGISTKSISIIISIAICFIPIFKQEIQNLINALNSRGFKTNFYNLITHPQYLFYPLFVSIFHKIDEIELSLIAKGYEL